MGYGSGSGSGSFCWLMATGFWNDGCFWIDSDIWDNGEIVTSFQGTTQNFEIVLDNASNNYVVTWGDGNSDVVLSGNTISHIFSTSNAKVLKFRPESQVDKVLEFLYTGIGNIGGDLDFSGYDSITNIDCINGNFDSIQLPISNTLTSLQIQTNNISELDVSSLTSLTFLRCDVNSISILDVTSLTSLMTLIVTNNTISVLDVTNLTSLNEFR